ncbi:MAG TPA: Ig-like domain-containing protein, partial [Vicinamibacterales bacterium]|nr:Ig-like domain-containing protein [Vicinamibacterales bacterium]
YRVRRARGNGIGLSTPVRELTAALAATSFDDLDLPHGEFFTYVVNANFVGGASSGPSDFAVVQAENQPPSGAADSYTTPQNTALVRTAAQGVLSNDTDPDTNPLSATFGRTTWLAFLETGPANGTLILNSNGSFTYTPRNGFKGIDTFTYRASNGTWTDPDDPSYTVPMSQKSAPITVSIEVGKK